MEVIGSILVVFAGAILGILGGGGSILTVPILVYLFRISAETSTSYSLFLVGIAASLGAIKYGRQKNIAYLTAILFAIPSFLGIFVVRRFLLPAIPLKIKMFDTIVAKDQIILIVFAIVMLLASHAMIKKRVEQREWAEGTPNAGYITVYGFFVGSVTGFVGAGGGFLIVPALNLLAKLSMKKAVGSSLFIIGISSFFGFFTSLGNTVINWNLVIFLSALSLLGIIIGGKLASKFSGAELKPVFGYFTLIMGLVILGQQVFL
ncbi:MAG: sulfite exporter TauE/SafE family protein [Oligoflexales bacterium]